MFLVVFRNNVGPIECYFYSLLKIFKLKHGPELLQAVYYAGCFKLWKLLYFVKLWKGALRWCTGASRKTWVRFDIEYRTLLQVYRS